MTPQSQSKEKKSDNLTSSKLKIFIIQGTPQEREKTVNNIGENIFYSYT